MSSKWSRSRDEASKDQGWLIAHTDGSNGHPPYELHCLQDDVDGGTVRLATDREAHVFVKAQANKGDALAVAALAFLKIACPEEYDTITNAKHEGWD